MTTAELLAKHGIKLETTAPGRYRTTCPKCSHTRRKTEANCLSVLIEADSACWNCFHCGSSGPEKGSGNGADRSELPHHPYREVDGVVRFRKVRNRKGREPKCWFEYPTINGGWTNKKKDAKEPEKIDTQILYRRDEIKKAIAVGRVIACVEGEKNADDLWHLGIAATTSAHGAHDPKLKQRPKWYRSHSEQLAGADFVVFNDNDAPGYAHAEATCERSLGIAKSVRRLDLKPHWPDMPEKADVSDWLAEGHTHEELEALIASAPDYVPAASTGATGEAAPGNGGTSGNGGASAPPIDDDAEIERLAKMRALDYDRARKPAATQLKVRASLLDKLVLAKRGELGLVGKGDDDQGEAVTFEDVEPWPGPVDGPVLLNDIAEAIGSHIIMESYERDIAALWIMHTYIVRHFMISPKLSIRSAVRGCGKTTLLDVLAHLVNRPWTTGSITKAALFRVISKWHPTFLIDEVDTFVGEDEELRGMINLSHRYDGTVTRTVGDSHEPRKFSVYAAVALSGIGGLATTLADRSVNVSLRRKKRDEKTKQLRMGRTGHLDELRRRIVRWIADHEETIAERDPEMPEAIGNREADNWIALLAIADQADGGWPARARAAATKAHAASADDDVDLVEHLLSDCRNILKQRAALIAEYNKTAEGKLAPIDKVAITSVALTDALTAIEDGPWREWGKSNKPITQHALARLLRGPGLNIHPEPRAIRTVKQVKDETTGQTWWMDIEARGYLLAAFQDAFDRLLPLEDARANPKKGDSNRPSVPNPINMGTSHDSEPSQDLPSGTVAKSQKPSLALACWFWWCGSCCPWGGRAGAERRSPCSRSMPSFEMALSTNCLAEISSRTAGWLLSTPVRVRITSPSRAMISARASARSMPAQSCARISIPPTSAIANSAITRAQNAAPCWPRGRGGWMPAAWDPTMASDGLSVVRGIRGHHIRGKIFAQIPGSRKKLITTQRCCGRARDLGALRNFLGPPGPFSGFEVLGSARSS
jgi:hypothetical protein